MKREIRKLDGSKRAVDVQTSPIADPIVSIRLSPALLGAVVKWAEKQSDAPTVSDAVRQLVEIALTARRIRKISDKQKARAKEMAGTAIDQLTDVDATAEEGASRKRRLLKGPEEFRQSRVDRAGKIK